MEELSLHILDIAQNSIKAEATLVQIEIRVVEARDVLLITIQDNGHGMTPEQVEKVTDPFFTTRTTRKLGLGVPFFKMAAEQTGGDFSLESIPGMGTVIVAGFGLTHIDRAPVGDIAATMAALIQLNGRTVDFVYRFCHGEEQFELDTREVRTIMEGMDITSPAVINFIQDYIKDNQKDMETRIGSDFNELTRKGDIEI